MKKIGYWMLGVLLMLTNCSNSMNQKSKLEESEFTLKKGSYDYPGLLDAKNVGVDEDQFYHQRLYGSEDQQNVYVIDAASFFVDGTDEKDDTAAFNACLDEARKHAGQTVKILLPAGELDFIESLNPLDRNYGIVLKDFEHLIISGQNTTIYFHGEMKGFLVENCNDVTFENLTIDYGVPPFSTGTILQNDGQTFTVRVHDGYVVDETTRISAFLEYNKTSYTPLAKGNDIYGDIKTVRYLGNQILEITFLHPYAVAPTGTLVVLRHYLYEYDLFFVNQCENIYFESIDIYSALGMAARCYSSKNLYFNRFNCTLKPNTDRLMSVTADAIHAIDCYGEVFITNSLFENCGDDAANVHGMYLEIAEVIDDHTVYAFNPRGYNFAPSVNDVMEINTALDLSLVYTSEVTSVVPRAVGFEITFADSFEGKVSPLNVIGNVTRSPELVFNNNIVRNKRCRGVLVQTRNVEIKNNTFANLSDAGILLTGDSNEWYEAMLAKNVVIANNKFLKNNFAVGNTGGDIAISAYGKGYNLAANGSIENIEIYNNFFANSANAGIFANSVRQLNIHHNLMSNVGISPKVKNFEAGIYLAYCDEVTLQNNVIYKNSSATFKPLSVGAGINADKITLNANQGFSREDLSDTTISIEASLPSVDLNTSLDMDGEDLLTWNKIRQTVQILGISDVDQNEREADPDSFCLNELKIAYDDLGLYLAFDVFDDEIKYAASASYWEGDGVEIFLSANCDSKDPLSVLKLNDDSCLQLFMSGHETYGNQVVELRTSAAVLEKKELILMNFTEKFSERGYVGKVFIPFTVIPKIKERIDQHEAFSFAINFSDADSNRVRIQYSNVSHPVEYNKYVPYKMGKLVAEEDAS